MADECTNCGKLNGGAVCGDCDGNADRDALIASQSARIAELERVLAKRVEDYDDLAETHEAVVTERDDLRLRVRELEEELRTESETSATYQQRAADLEYDRDQWSEECARLKSELGIESRARLVFEAELAESEEETERLAHGLELATRQVAAMGAERDAVRKALAFGAERSVVILADHVSFMVNELADRKMHHDGTPEGVEAALLAAAREGGAK